MTGIVRRSTCNAMHTRSPFSAFTDRSNLSAQVPAAFFAVQADSLASLCSEWLLQTAPRRSFALPGHKPAQLGVTGGSVATAAAGCALLISIDPRRCRLTLPDNCIESARARSFALPSRRTDQLPTHHDFKRLEAGGCPRRRPQYLDRTLAFLQRQRCSPTPFQPGAAVRGAGGRCSHAAVGPTSLRALRSRRSGQQCRFDADHESRRDADTRHTRAGRCFRHGEPSRW